MPYGRFATREIKEIDIARPNKQKLPPSESIKTFTYALAIIEGLSAVTILFYNPWIALYIAIFTTISTFILYLWARTAETHESINDNLAILIDQLRPPHES